MCSLLEAPGHRRRVRFATDPKNGGSCYKMWYDKYLFCGGRFFMVLNWDFSPEDVRHLLEGDRTHKPCLSIETARSKSIVEDCGRSRTERRRSCLSEATSR